jgi:hypothetical protein
LVLWRSILACFLFYLRFYLNWRGTFLIILSFWFIFFCCLRIFLFIGLWWLFSWLNCFFDRCRILNICIFMYCFFIIIFCSKLSFFLIILSLFFYIALWKFFLLWL